MKHSPPSSRSTSLIHTKKWTLLIPSVARSQTRRRKSMRSMGASRRSMCVRPRLFLKSVLTGQGASPTRKIEITTRPDEKHTTNTIQIAHLKMSNTTNTSLRHQQDVSVLDAAATTLLSYFLLRIIQWILTSNVFIIFGKAILIFAASGIVATIFTPSQPSSPTQKGLNGDYHIPSKKHV